ncbi:hypothetical protein K435DRAFT_764271 [Dendrothele bispora CBS 962.96]|uniref:Thioredoxin-like protein n=1 Tax=Dendrothele bispora (strain CBS 962.96) TaxID=1314807 RepID=A0A4V4HD17_DENBC|nr:hypothetical protein K435DRAFT_764271 [Dendrothele bispora CBS 962.96]
MFSGFVRKAIPELSIFHHPSSPPSTKALALLRSATSGPYPPGKSSPPLDYKLEVIEAPPTADQLRTILSYVSPSKESSSPSPSRVFLSAHPSAPTGYDQPHDVSGVHDLAVKNPNALKWPIVVDWTGGKASVGDVEGVKNILEHLRKKRDGELKDEEDIHQPKGWFS